MMKKIKHTLLGILLLFGTQFSFAQTADEIIDKHLEAIGGKEKLRQVTSLKVNLKMKMQNFEFPVYFCAVKDGSSKTETTIQGMKMEQAFDASTQTGWSVNPMMGDKSAQKMNEEELQEIKDNDRLTSPLLDYKIKGHSAEYLGKDDVDGEEVHVIMLTKKNGSIIYYYISTTDYLEIKEVTKTKLKEKEFESETYMYNYTDYNGMKTAMTTESYSDGKVVMQMNIEKVEYNTEVDPKIFKMPEAKK